MPKEVMKDVTKNFASASPDADIDEEKVEEEETILTYLDGLISEKPLTIVEESFHEDAEQSVRAVEDGHGGRKLIFDKKKVSSQEEELIERFLKVFNGAEKGKRKEAFLQTDHDGDGFNIQEEFGWYFEEEDEQFFEELAKKLSGRLEDLRDGVDELSSAGLGNVDEAMNFFRSKAHRRLIKESLSDQTAQLPIIGFKARRQDGSVVDLRYNPADLNDPTNEVDVIYVNADDGKQELIITFNNPDYIDIVPIVKSESGKFEIPEGGLNKESGFNDAGEVENWWSIDVEQGENTKDPLFSRIKIVRKSMDLDKELDEYLARKAEEERRRAAAAYRSQAPSAAATPTRTNRYSSPAPTNYVRSG